LALATRNFPSPTSGKGSSSTRKSAAGGAPAGATTIAYIARDEADTDAILAQAVAAGASLHVPAHKAVCGGCSGCFLDPDGHPRDVAYNRFFPLAEDGSVILPD
jgi:uncharacterized protein